MILPLGAEIISSDQAKAIHSPSRNKATHDFAAWGRNYLVGSGEGDSLAEPYQST